LPLSVANDTGEFDPLLPQATGAVNGSIDPKEAQLVV
jgi:hypothetical protein